MDTAGCAMDASGGERLDTVGCTMDASGGERLDIVGGKMDASEGERLDIVGGTMDASEGERLDIVGGTMDASEGERLEGRWAPWLGSDDVWLGILCGSEADGVWLGSRRCVARKPTMCGSEADDVCVYKGSFCVRVEFADTGAC